MTATLPNYDEICGLPATREAIVTPELIDENGHMSTTHYFDLCGVGADGILQRIGINNEYREVRRMGVFAADQHLRYFAELREGEEFSVHPRVLAHSDKAFHVLCLLVNASQRRLACTMETTFVHVNLETRRATPMPVDLVLRLEGRLAEHHALNWDVPLCGFRGRS
jgi:acyl-CoA thioester hydrolase